MIFGTGCLGEDALAPSAILSALEALKLDRVLLVTPPGARPTGALREVPAVAVRAPWDEVAAGIAAARRAGARRLVLDLAAGADLEPACRDVFALGRAHPGLELAVVTPAEGPLARPASLALLLEDRPGLGYWHRASRVHALGDDSVAWLDACGGRMVGFSLDDVLSGEDGLPPGVGELDLRRLAQLIGRSVEGTIDVDPLPDVGLLEASIRTLSALGFA